MITRIWHGKTLTKYAEKYLDYLRETKILDYSNTPGNLSAKILRNINGDICYFYAISEWKDIESIKAFAGTDYLKAKHYAQDDKYLIDFVELVEHFETFTD